MKNLIKKAKTIVQLFPETLTKEQRFINLVEEVGELANAIAITEGHKSKKRQRSYLRDSFADVFFNLIILASQFGVDLEDELETMLTQLQKRIQNHEFDG